MRSAVNKLSSLTFFLFFSLIAYSQDNTVFITAEDEPEKDKKYEGHGFFSQFSGAMYFQGNNEKKTENDDDDKSPFIPDGLKAHAGFGVHLKEWIGVAVNSGIDYQITPKLAFTPVYGTVFLNPHFGMDSSFVLEAGYGWAFAIGRGDLSGFYQKYRLGYMNDERISIFLEYSRMDFKYDGYKFAGGLCVGLSIYNFL